MKLIVNTTTYLFFAVLLTACATNVQSLKEDKKIQLAAEEGYLFLGVRTDSALSKLIISGRKKVALTSDDLKQGSNYILINLPAGKYEISLIQAGRLKWITDDDDLWSFEVKPTVVSYVVDLEIERSWRYARFALVNNSSRAYEFLEDRFKKIISETVVEYSGPGEDSFFKVVRENKVNGEEK